MFIWIAAASVFVAGLLYLGSVHLLSGDQKEAQVNGLDINNNLTETSSVDGLETREAEEIAASDRDIKQEDGTEPLRVEKTTAIFRANSQRTGVYNTKGVHQLNELKWKFKTGGVVESSPVVADGVVYVGSEDNNVYAIDASSGQEKWRFDTGSSVFSSSVIANGVAYTGDNNLYAIDVNSGQEKWNFKPSYFGSASSPIIKDDTIYFGANYGCLYAVNIKYGLKEWKFESEYASELEKYGYGKTSPAIENEIIFFGLSFMSFDNGIDCDGYFYAVDLRTGQEKWMFKTEKSIWSTPAISNNVVFFGSHDGYLYSIDTKTGQEKWKFKTGDAVHSSPAISDETVYFGSRDGYLYALDTRSGQQKWKFRAGDEISSSPSIADGVIYFGSRDGYLYALDTQNGQKKWKFRTGDSEFGVVSSPVIADGVIYFGSNDGYIYALQ